MTRAAKFEMQSEDKLNTKAEESANVYYAADLNVEEFKFEIERAGHHDLSVDESLKGTATGVMSSVICKKNKPWLLKRTRNTSGKMSSVI